MFHRPVKRLGFPLLSFFILTSLAGCQTLNDVLRPAEKPPEPVKAEVVKAEPVKPVECPKPRTITRKITVYTPAKVGNKHLFGAVEMSQFASLNLDLPARINTGARTTSLHAMNIVFFERDGKDWVRFDTPNGENKNQQHEKPLKRIIRIKRKGAGSVERPVVELKVQIGEVTQRLEVNLTDRSNFEYPALIGRDFLQDLVIVDVSKTYIADQPEARPKQEATR